MLEYASHAAKTSYNPATFEVKCLLCRASWGLGALPWLQRSWDTSRRQANASGVAVLDGKRGSEVHSGTHCAGCRATPIKGSRYCCVRCGPSRVDLCEECFGRGRHAQHAFVVRESVGAPWKPVPRQGGAQVWRPAAPLGAAGLSQAALVALQTREIGPNDFDLLLLLDQGRQPRQQAVVPVAQDPNAPPQSLGVYLAESLSASTLPPESTSCAHCGQLLAQPPPEGTLVDFTRIGVPSGAEQPAPRRRPRHRRYSCGHTTHTACAAFAAESGAFACPILDCSVPTFPGLFRKPRPTGEAGREVQPAATDVAATSSALGLGGAAGLRGRRGREGGRGDPTSTLPLLDSLSISSVRIGSVANASPETQPPPPRSSERPISSSSRREGRLGMRQPKVDDLSGLIVGGNGSAAFLQNTESTQRMGNGLHAGTDFVPGDNRAARGAGARRPARGAAARRERSNGNASAVDMASLEVIVGAPTEQTLPTRAETQQRLRSEASAKAATKAAAAKAARGAMLAAEAERLEANLAEKLARQALRSGARACHGLQVPSKRQVDKVDLELDLILAPPVPRGEVKPEASPPRPPPVSAAAGGGPRAHNQLQEHPRSLPPGLRPVVTSTANANSVVATDSSELRRCVGTAAGPGGVAGQEAPTQGTHSDSSTAGFQESHEEANEEKAAALREHRRSEALAALHRRRAAESLAAERRRTEAELRLWELPTRTEEAQSTLAEERAQAKEAREARALEAAARRRDLQDQERTRNFERSLARTEAEAAAERRREASRGSRLASAPHDVSGAGQPVPRHETRNEESEAPRHAERAPSPNVFARQTVANHSAEVERRREHRRRETDRAAAREAALKTARAVAQAQGEFGDPGDILVVDAVRVFSENVAEPILEQTRVQRAPRSAPLPTHREVYHRRGRAGDPQAANDRRGLSSGGGAVSRPTLRGAHLSSPAATRLANCAPGADGSSQHNFEVRPTALTRTGP